MATLPPPFVEVPEGTLSLDMIWAQQGLASGKLEGHSKGGDQEAGFQRPCGEAVLLARWEARGPWLAADSGLLICWHLDSPPASRSVMSHCRHVVSPGGAPAAQPFITHSPLCVPGESGMRKYSTHLLPKSEKHPTPLKYAQGQLAPPSSRFQGEDQHYQQFH